MQTTIPNRYPTVIIILHWLTVLLFVLVYSSMEFRDLFAKGTDARNLMKTTHYAFGLTIFMLFWLRILARSIMPTPSLSYLQPKWQRYLAALTHSSLYGLMLMQPILGWLLINAQQSSTIIFGITLPQLLTQNAVAEDLLEELHEIIATAGYILIGLHSAAALVHHYYFKDNSLQKMLLDSKQHSE